MVTAVSNERVFATADQQKLNLFDPLLGLSIKLGGVERKDLPGYHEKVRNANEALKEIRRFFKCSELIFLVFWLFADQNL